MWSTVCGLQFENDRYTFFSVTLTCVYVTIPRGFID